MTDPQLTAALARLRAWVRSEAEGADLPEHYPHTFRGQMDVDAAVAGMEAMTQTLRKVGNLLCGGHHSEALGVVMEALGDA
jgi:hypothetical protein